MGGPSGETTVSRLAVTSATGVMQLNLLSMRSSCGSGTKTSVTGLLPRKTGSLETTRHGGVQPCSDSVTSGFLRCYSKHFLAITRFYSRENIPAFSININCVIFLKHLKLCEQDVST